MFIPRPHAARPVASYSLEDDDNVDMFIPRSALPGRGSGTNRGDKGNSTPSGSSIPAPIRNMDVEIADSDMFVPRPSGDRRISPRDRNTLNRGVKRHDSSSDFEHKDLDNQVVIADGMEFTPRQSISRPAPPVDGDVSEAALKLIRWAMQARALLATIEALQSKFKVN